MGLTNSPLCRRCGAEDETLAHILFECEALASLRHIYLGSFFSFRGHKGYFSKGIWYQIVRHKGPVFKS